MIVINDSQQLTLGKPSTNGSTEVPPSSPTVTVKTNKTLQYYMARMAAGEEVKIACYGDSTTDGHSTTGWVQNPITSKNEAVGNTNHEETALNAWPKKLQDILRDMYSNENIHVYNAGYSGRTLADGWAVRNFPVAITNNPNYGVCDIVFVDFGLNDIPTAGSQLNETIEQTNLLIDEIEKTGALPVLLASGPSWRADSDRSKKELLFETNTIKKDIAAQRGIPFIDKAALMTEWLETNVEYPWLVLEADGLHFNDDGHRVQASLIAAELFSGLIKIENEKDVQHISFMDNRVVCPIGYGGHYNTQTPRFPNILFTKNYLNSNLGQEVLTFWFKVKNDSTAMFYNAIRNEGITNIANPINTKLVNLCTNKEIVNAPSPNQGFLPSSTNGDNGSFPLLLDVLNHGIYKISITLPAVTDTFPKGAFLGYFSFYPKWQRTPLGSSIVKTINPIYHRVGDISGTRELFYKGVTPDGENHWGLGWKVKKSTLFFKASLSKLAGLGILDFEGVNAKTDDRYKTIGMFKDEKDGLALLILNLGQRGGASSSTNPDTAFSCGTLADGEEKEFKFVLEKTESGVTFSFYEGYNSTDPVTTVNMLHGEKLLFPLSGAFGSTWSYKGNTSVKVSEAFVLEEKL